MVFVARLTASVWVADVSTSGKTYRIVLSWAWDIE